MAATAGSYASSPTPCSLAQTADPHLFRPGSLTGIGEIVLLPLDVLKIKRQ